MKKLIGKKLGQFEEKTSLNSEFEWKDLYDSDYIVPLPYLLYFMITYVL